MISWSGCSWRDKTLDDDGDDKAIYEEEMNRCTWYSPLQYRYMTGIGSLTASGYPILQVLGLLLGSRIHEANVVVRRRKDARSQIDRFKVTETTHRCTSIVPSTTLSTRRRVSFCRTVQANALRVAQNIPTRDADNWTAGQLHRFHDCRSTRLHVRNPESTRGKETSTKICRRISRIFRMKGP